MRGRRAAAWAVLVATLLFGLITLVALEAGDMAVLRTQQADGSERRTRVWFAEDDGALWIEAATDSRPFYLDLQRQPLVTVEVRRGSFLQGSTLLRAGAEPIAEPGGHDRIRRLLADKYGWADRWISLLQDTSASRALRLVPVAAAVEDGPDRPAQPPRD